MKGTPSICLITFMITAAALVLVPNAAAENSGWRPWSNEEPAFRSNIERPQFYQSRIAERSGLTADELETMLAKMADILEVFQQVPVLNPPQGMRIVPHRHILSKHEQTGRARAMLWMPIYREQSSHFGSEIIVFVNEMLAGSSFIGEDDQGKMYLPPVSLGEVGGFPLYQLSDERARALLIIQPDRFPWLPVSQERWIQHTIDSTRAQLDEYQEEAVAQAERRLQYVMELIDTYESWLDDPFMSSLWTSEQIEELICSAERMREEYAAKVQLEQQAVAALQAQDYNALEELSRTYRSLAMMGRTLLLLEEELALLPLEERSSPAYGLEMPAPLIHFPSWEPERTSLLLDPDHDRALTLIAPDPRFYRAGLPAATIQSLVIVQKAPRTQSGQGFMEEIRQTLDLEALAALLD